MKKSIILVLIAAGLVLSLQACEDYLDKTLAAEGMHAEDVFTNYLNYRQFNDGIYLNLHDYLSTFDMGALAAVSDEGYTVSNWETLQPIQDGNWLGAVESGPGALAWTVWSDANGQSAWTNIRTANRSIKNIQLLIESGDATQEQIDEIKGQAHFMRAWWYFELMRRHGGLPYITKVFEKTDNLAIPRDSFYETAKNIAADSDTAATLLPEEWNESNNYGRPTYGAALALKATALLFAASPRYNPNDDMTRWEEAANASWDFINYAESTGQYSLQESTTPTTMEYMTPGGPQTIIYNTGRDSVFMYKQTNDEIIWENWGARNDVPFQTFGTPRMVTPLYMTGFSPSQNIVDKFETTNGLDIEDDPDYNPQNPYIDRDPRFYQTILFNQRKWGGERYLELWSGGADRQNTKYYSYTGYLSNKYWPSYVHNESSTTQYIAHRIYLRYADILLQYAEAVNELSGPNGTASAQNATLTAVEAVNMVRNRVGMPDVASQYLTDKATFRERIRNERAVELYYEQKRFFDVQRWGIGHLQKNKEIYGVDIVEAPGSPTGYSYSRSNAPIHTNTFNDPRHYLMPIPSDDVNMFDVFEQNPGW